ncbi:uncharacterized protein LOC128552977 [Mercenaria mercenaria]|uniref:uncharacterized protein LOC128552977 n=1 Tax=Mercenaria mercenaria TaxID=6596 RepID=UPI00234E3A21|nr:uncharacterized protein LOC128552977 [Mercenaria mercenaria]
MTVDSFILALRRFFSRRAIPKIIMSDNALTYISTAKLLKTEILGTYEVECIVNDRPLTHISTDPTDEEPLTPSHLLYGRRITSPVYPDDREATADDISHNSADKLYRFKSATIEHFWSRWKHEYLTSLRQFHKMSGNHGDTLTVGDVVQIHDNNLPRNRWSLGVIEDVVTGRDGLIRAARIRSRRGVTMRPIAKLYPLELK